MTIDDLMRMSPVIPVLVIDDIDDAIPIAQALVAGGLRVLEVTLRTPVAIEALRAMATVEGAVVGAGTVLNTRALDAVALAGAKFVVSPGMTDPLARAAIAIRMPFLGGVASASDIMRGLDLGLDAFKFFPAATSGGLPALRALSGPFAKVKFCPTGGVTLATAPEWLAEPVVTCVGGSWIVPRGKPDLAAIEAGARAAMALRPPAAA